MSLCRLFTVVVCVCVVGLTLAEFADKRVTAQFQPNEPGVTTVGTESLPVGAIVRAGTPRAPKGIGVAVRAAFLPNGRTVVSLGLDRQLIFWDARTGKITGTAEGTLIVRFAPDGRRAALRNQQDKEIRIRDLGSGKQVGQVPGDTNCCFSSNGRYLAVGGGTAYGRPDDPPLRIWDLDTWKVAHELGLREWVNAIQFSPDGKRLAVSRFGYRQPAGQVWDVETGKVLWQLFEKEKPPSPTTLVFSPGGDRLAAMGHGPNVCVWNADSGKEAWRIQNLQNDGATTGAYSPNGEMIAVGMSKGTIYLFEALTGKERGRFEGPPQYIYSLAFSPCGLLLVSGIADGTCLTWDVVGVIRRDAHAVIPFSATELSACWSAVGRQDAAKAWQAICGLAARPGQAVDLLKERLPACRNPKLHETPLARYIRELDSDDFITREVASAELASLGPVAVPSLQKVAASTQSAEGKRRAKQLLSQIENGGHVGEETRYRRAVEVLEYIGTPAAKRVLEAEARAEPVSSLIQPAKAALDRLAKHRHPDPSIDFVAILQATAQGLERRVFARQPLPRRRTVRFERTHLGPRPPGTP